MAIEWPERIKRIRESTSIKFTKRRKGNKEIEAADAKLKAQSKDLKTPPPFERLDYWPVLRYYNNLHTDASVAHRRLPAKEKWEREIPRRMPLWQPTRPQPYHAQVQSLLFKLPLEIRNMVYMEYMRRSHQVYFWPMEHLESYDHEWKKDPFRRQKNRTALLRSCKRIHLEASPLIMSNIDELIVAGDAALYLPWTVPQPVLSWITQITIYKYFSRPALFYTQSRAAYPRGRRRHRHRYWGRDDDDDADSDSGFPPSQDLRDFAVTRFPTVAQHRWLGAWDVIINHLPALVDVTFLGQVLQGDRDYSGFSKSECQVLEPLRRLHGLDGSSDSPAKETDHEEARASRKSRLNRLKVYCCWPKPEDTSLSDFLAAEGCEVNVHYWRMPRWPTRFWQGENTSMDTARVIYSEHDPAFVGALRPQRGFDDVQGRFLPQIG